MKKESFMNLLKETLESFDIETEFVDVKKPNGTYTGMCMTGKKMSAIVNIDGLYERYEAGNVTFAEALREIRACFSTKIPGEDDILEYEKVKDKLLVKCMNAETEYVKDKVYVQVEDIALVSYINMDDYSVPVNQGMLKMYGKTNEEVFFQAMKNTIKQCEPQIFNVDELVSHLVPLGDGTEKSNMIALTNTKMYNGAVVLFYPGMMELIRDVIGDYYVFPSSVHEVMIVKKECYMSEQEMKQMIRSINKEMVDEEDVLTDSLYLCDEKGFHKI